MIVNQGKVLLLQAQLSYLNGTYFVLFTNNVTVVNTLTWSGITEAAWTGYARQLATTWAAAALVGTVAASSLSPFPSFTNTSGSPVTFYGWAMIDSSVPTLIAAVNIGVTTIPNGGSYTLNPTITDDEA